MRSRNRKLGIAGMALGLLALGVFGFIRAGIYNIGADDPHYRATYSLLNQLRTASIARRAANLTVPKDLLTPSRIVHGAGNYGAMCMQCHLAPGIESTELSRGLYPAPPVLSEMHVGAAEAFWTIKHGVKASGMPAWGASMDDESIWNMAAFLQALPRLDADEYRSMIARSGGHSHGGDETLSVRHHAQEVEDAAHHHDHGEDAPASTHVDASGTPPHHHVAPADHKVPPA